MFFNSIFSSIDENYNTDDNPIYQMPDKSEPYNIHLLNAYLLQIMKKHLNDNQYHTLRLSFGLDCDKASAIEIAKFLSPDIAIFLNLSSDHLDRHGGIGGYFNSKARLFYSGMPKYSIINVDQPEGKYLANYLEQSANFDTKVIHISSKKIINRSNWSISLINGSIIERKNGIELFKSNYLASKDVNAWLGLYKVL